MKKRTFILIIVLLVLIGAGGAFGYMYLSDNLSLISKTLTSEDGAYSINVPASWKLSDSESANAVLSAESSNSSMYAMVSLDTADFENGSTAEDYVYAYINTIAANSDDPLVQVISVTPYEVKMGDYTGYYFELDSVADGLPLHLWNFCFTANGGYVHINVASSGEENSEFDGIAKGIINSLTLSKAS